MKGLKKVTINYDDIEKPQLLADNDKPIDAVYFNGANAKNDALIVGMARRKAPLIDGFLLLRLSTFKSGVLQSLRLPETSLTQIEPETGYCAEGISLKPVVAKKKWEIKYDGQMRDAEGTLHTVQLKLYWTSEKECFNFDHDMDPYLMATAIAKERWNKEYFDLVKRIHQTHYEQPGDINGTAIIDGTVHEVNLKGLRDHSFGNHRDWRYFHRYILHFCTLENGDQMNIGMVSMPLAFSLVYIGYYYNAAKNKMYALQACDFPFYQHGENGVPPVDYAFQFKAGDQEYIMEVNVIESNELYISKDCEAKIFESYSNYKVNGIKGWGHVELQYKNVAGKAAIKI